MKVKSIDLKSRRIISAPEVVDILQEGVHTVITLNDSTRWIADLSLAEAKAWRETGFKDTMAERFPNGLSGKKNRN